MAPPSSQPTSKRDVLQLASLGFISPVTVKAKASRSRTVEKKTEWDWPVPYLLPPNHPFTTLIVYGIHRKQLHSGVNVVVTLLRQTFWITSIRQYVKKLLRGYVTCWRVEGTTFRAPNPAPLPKMRVQEATPFSVKGVDFT